MLLTISSLLRIRYKEEIRHIIFVFCLIATLTLLTVFIINHFQIFYESVNGKDLWYDPVSFAHIML